jgi:pimeloyl-ACP methyl ester carboxylesterase
MVSEPTGSPTAAVLFFPGWGGTRSGTNRMWARLAQEWSELGALCLRVDYPGWWESDPGRVPGLPGPDTIEAMREALEWFRARADGIGIILAGSCYGGRLALTLAQNEPDVRGVAFIAAWFRRELPRRSNAARRILRPALPALRRLIGNGRYGKLRRPVMTPRSVSVLHMLADVAARMPVWMLVGERDGAAADLEWLTAQLLADAHLVLEVVPGEELHTYESPVAQEETISRTLAWTRDLMRQKMDA